MSTSPPTSPPAPPARGSADGPRSAPRRSRSPGIVLALLTLATALASAGCGREDDLIGTGPIRSVSVGADGTAFVLRAWRDRTPNAAVLLIVDPLSGGAAPILPKLGGHRGASIREIEFAVTRPATADPSENALATAELVIGGPDIGIAVIRGPFAYLGAFPEVVIEHEGRFLPPDGGPADAVSPDGRHLLLFETARAPAAGTPAWGVVVVDLETLALARTDGTVPTRAGGWIAAGRFQLDDPARTGHIAADGTIVFADGDANPDQDRQAPDAARLALAASLIAAIPETNGESVAGYCPWPAANRVPGTPRLHGLAWTAHAVYRLTGGPDDDGPTTAIPLTLTFDRGD